MDRQMEIEEILASIEEILEQANLFLLVIRYWWIVKNCLI